MSRDAASTTVVLSGRVGGTTHREVELLGKLPPDLRLIGGLAVMCRVGMPHRTTVDLDTVARDAEGLHESLARLAVSAPGGGQYSFAGEMDLDVIEIAESDAADLARALLASGERLTDLELNVIGHTWAHDEATPIDIVAVDEINGGRLAAAESRLVATVAGLVVMKSMTVRLRASTRPEKRASDLYDLSRLLTVGELSSSDLDPLPPVLRDAVVDRLIGWFLDDAGRDRTYRDVRRFDEPAIELDVVADAVERLVN